MINYGIVYGLSDYGLADRLNIPREEAKEFIDAYLERFPRVAAFMAETIERAKEEGYVKTLWGRRRQIPELRARNYQVRTLGERLAVNTVIQGTAADIIKLAMVRCHRALAESRLADAPDADDPRRAAVRRAARRGGGRARADRARDGAACGTREPPLAVDVGVGAELAGGEVSAARTARVSRGWRCCWASAPAAWSACRRRSTRAWAGRWAASRRRPFSFLVGTVALVLIAALRAAAGSAVSATSGRAPWWALIGGLLGAVYVTVALVAVRTLGASGLTAVVITGQLAISVVIDRFGLLGIARQHDRRAAHRRARAAGGGGGAGRAQVAQPRQPSRLSRAPCESPRASSA